MKLESSIAENSALNFDLGGVDWTINQQQGINSTSETLYHIE